jgi:hypothetical protein
MIDVLTGIDSVEHVANTLDVPPGQVLAWCDRVRTALVPSTSAPWHRGTETSPSLISPSSRERSNPVR